MDLSPSFPTTTLAAGSGGAPTRDRCATPTVAARMTPVSEDVDAAKRDLREQFLERRRGLSAQAISDARAAVRAAVLAHAAEDGWRRVAGYLPLRTEPGSVELLDGLSAVGIEVLVPVLLPNRDLDWAEWRAAREQLGPTGGVAAIARADAVLAPALAVAADGTRLGRGGGPTTGRSPESRPRRRWPRCCTTGSWCSTSRGKTGIAR